jgi:methanogenic corrinoid protein MtbC1
MGISVDVLVQKVKQENISILLVSTLMLRSALQVKDLKGRLKEAGLNVKIVVGGAPFLLDPGLWMEVGADAMATTPSEAIRVIKQIDGVATVWV